MKYYCVLVVQTHATGGETYHWQPPGAPAFL